MAVVHFTIMLCHLKGGALAYIVAELLSQTHLIGPHTVILLPVHTSAEEWKTCLLINLDLPLFLNVEFVIFQV